jgi:hypothetical protein
MTSRKTSVSGDFRHPGQLFRNLPDFYQILVDDILWGFHWFLGLRVHIPCFLQTVSLPVQPELLSTIPEDRMTHFVTLTVPPPRTDHSLRRSTTRVGLRARRFRIFSRKRPFRAIFVSYSTRFLAPGQTFWKPPGLSQNPCRWHFMRFPLIFGP